VAAYAVVCGLAGVALDGLEIPAVDAQVASVELETDSPVDDIRFRFTTGWTADIQAKRALTYGTTFEKAIAQWAEAGRAGVDPTRHRLVLTAGHLSGPVRELRDALNRRRLPHAAEPTQTHGRALKRLEAHLASLTDQQRSRVLDAAVIWQVQVEELAEPDARQALTNLRLAGYSSDLAARNAWDRLRTTADMLARRRGGYDLDHWLNDLRGVGLAIDPAATTLATAATPVPAARIEQRTAALARYCDRLVHEAKELDLSSLGAKLPPLLLDDVDADVQVGGNDADTRDKRDLFWGFLRRHRVVLTGLPGGGKSTAVRKVSGQLAARAHADVVGEQVGDTAYPFPVRASLRDVNARDKTISFRDRLIDEAVHSDSAADRVDIRAEVEHRLDEGLPIALLLDALDETYDDRADVVGELRRFLAGLPDAALVLIATRDVAYGEAATLGWADLRMLPPEDVNPMLNAILAKAAEHRRVPDQQRDEWVSERLGWIRQALRHDTGLAETPLIPTLLAVLAIEGDPQALPTRRALVLRDVVAQLMGRFEVKRRGSRPLGRLTGEEVAEAALMAYAAEATAILNANGAAPLDVVISAVAGVLQTQWSMPPAAARVAAASAIEFLDETGVFVISPADRKVTARVSLFAEIGDALHALADPHQVADPDQLLDPDPGMSPMRTWLRRRIDSGQLEPVILAAALSDTANHLCQQELESGPESLQLARAMVRAHREGTPLRETTLHRLRTRLIESLREGTEDAWSDWARIETLGVPGDLVEDVIEAASIHSPQHALYVRGFITLEHEKSEPGTISNDLLFELLKLEDLPRSANEPDKTYTLASLLNRTVLSRTQLAAAEILLERKTPGTVDAIGDLSRHTSAATSKGLAELLTKFGHDKAVEQFHEWLLGDAVSSELPQWMTNLSELNGYPRFLKLAAEGPRAPLGTRQRVELRELGDFVETLRLNAPGAGGLYRRGDQFLRDLVPLTCQLFSFSREVVAAEAQVVLDRLAVDDGFETFYSLFDTAQARTDTDWSMVPDPAAAAEVLLRMFMFTPDQGRVAAACLWESEIAAPFADARLRDIITRLDLSPRHQFWAALAFATLPTTPSPDEWWDDPNPVLRGIAALAVPVLTRKRLSQRFTALLEDPDGHVRVTAIKRLERLEFVGREEVLERAAKQPNPGWRCEHCAAENPPGATTCRTEKCYSGGPDPKTVAAKMLRNPTVALDA
jgi:ribosomal protein L40E